MELYLTAILFVIYGILSVVGYLNWKKNSTPNWLTPNVVSPKGDFEGTAIFKSPSGETTFGVSQLGVIILADGLFPSSEKVQNLLREAETIVCCDGAAQKLLDFGVEPDYIVGDLDSLSAELKQRFTQKIIQNTDQETNDLTKAVEFCISKNWKQIVILGATGLREDHTLGNISLLCDYKKQLDKVAMISDFGTFTPIFETTTFNSYLGQQVSIFALNQKTKLTFNGLKYPVTNQSFTSWWQGTLNSALGNFFL